MKIQQDNTKELEIQHQIIQYFACQTLIPGYFIKFWDSDPQYATIHRQEYTSNIPNILNKSFKLSAVEYRPLRKNNIQDHMKLSIMRRNSPAVPAKLYWEITFFLPLHINSFCVCIYILIIIIFSVFATGVVNKCQRRQSNIFMMKRWP